ncbi:hypothetical protein PG989_012660 [Apiospora arundinis]
MPRYYIPAVATAAKQHENKQELAVPQSYDWDANMCEFKQQARHEGLEELPASQVGRVIEEGKLTGLFDLGHIIDVELVVKKEMMQDSEERIIGWAVLIQPKVIPEKRRKPAEGQPQSAQQQKRFAN